MGVLQLRYSVIIALGLSLYVFESCNLARFHNYEDRQLQDRQSPVGEFADGRHEGTVLPTSTSDIHAVPAYLERQSTALASAPLGAGSTVQHDAHGQQRHVHSKAHRCLSLNVYWEARNQSVAGQIAVAQVTLNRTRDPRFPNNVCDVVYDHKQFSWYWDGKSDWPVEADAWESSKLVASAAMAGTGHVELQGVTHYHAVYSQPYWRDSMTQVTTIGDHVFYTDMTQTGRMHRR